MRPALQAQLVQRDLREAGCVFGVTAAAGLVAIPVEPIPGIDFLYDILVPVGQIIYWIMFFKRAAGMMSGPSPSPPRGQRQIAHDHLRSALSVTVEEKTRPDKASLGCAWGDRAVSTCQ
jgi:hypothetical protein